MQRLIQFIRGKYKTNIEKWKKTPNKWVTLNADPFHCVSTISFKLFDVKFCLSQIYHLQGLITEVGQPKAYRLDIPSLHKNLKRHTIWKSAEVHAIYALFYTMCTSKN